ncbi:carbamoyltransferase [Candidatus Woesearchaeota archaeon]|nr:carbamoyltransferase [Candidatus Woesearchaeota archaeon]
MYVLGISCYYHDSAACLLKDGRIIAAAEEERFTRKKHDNSFPKKAALYCLKEAEIAIDKIDYIAFYEKPLLKFDRLLSQYLESFPKGFWSFYKALPSWLHEKLRVPSMMKKHLKYKGEILFVEHHMAHAASAFLVSPFDEASIFTIDGVGEWATASIGVGKGSDITIAKEIVFPNSLGLLYSTVTAHLGFKVNNDEYKVMGLAAYGKPSYYDSLKKLIRIANDGSFQLDMSYFDFHYKMTMPSKKFIKEFGPIRKRESNIEQRHKDLAKSLQKITEEIIFKILNDLYKKTKIRKLCMAGGVALNSVANGKISRSTSFKNIFIQPAASDAGTAMGTAFYAYNTILKNKRKQILEHVYFGPGYTREEIKSFLDFKKINYSELSDSDILKKSAELIYQDNVIGWFQGRMEWGPRALGNRSILANPLNPKMQDILNAKVKHREMFRPFAPVVTWEDAKDYFDVDREVPYMLYVYPVKKEKRQLIPSVTHVDGSGRLQTIKRKQNQKYYDLIKEFERLSKVPILINTSFNIRGEPIVCTPEEAYRCMMGTGIDYLVIDNFLIARKENPKHMWNSESIAKD